eukprot:COSAG04_NODE_5965_length_1446_cov_3.048998_1_plen_146_part_00
MEHRDGIPDGLLLILIRVGHAAHVAVGAPCPAVAGGLGLARQVGEDVAEQHEHILPLVVHAAHTAYDSSAQLEAGGGSGAGSGARALGGRPVVLEPVLHLELEARLRSQQRLRRQGPTAQLGMRWLLTSCTQSAKGRSEAVSSSL